MTATTTKRRRRTERPSHRLYLGLGLLALAVVAIGGYISINALKGLPFESHYDVSVVVGDADRLIATDDVRIGDIRVGQVAGVVAEPGRPGQPPYAVVHLQLSPSVGRLPVDTAVQVQAASVLGATYVDLTPGHSHRTVPPGGTLPESQSRPTVDVTNLFQLFKGSAARSFQQSTADFAYGLAGRGADFNDTIASLSALMAPLTIVSQTLAAPATQLSRFITASDRAFAGLAPVSNELAGLFRGGAVTFAAFAAVPRAVAAAIEDAPPAEITGTAALQAIKPGLEDLARLMAAIAPSAPDLEPALTTLNQTFQTGTPALRHLPAFSRALQSALVALEQISRIPSTSGALRKLSELAVAFKAAIDPLEQAQIHCNVLPLSFLGISGFNGSLGTGDGPALTNTSIDNPGDSTDNEQSADVPPDGHINYRPEENGTECAAGNEPAPAGSRDLTNPTGLPDRTRSTSPPPGVLGLARKTGLLAEMPPA